MDGWMIRLRPDKSELRRDKSVSPAFCGIRRDKSVFVVTSFGLCRTGWMIGCMDDWMVCILHDFRGALKGKLPLTHGFGEATPSEQPWGTRQRP